MSALSDEDREYAWNLGASLSITEAHLDLLEEIAASVPRVIREGWDSRGPATAIVEHQEQQQ